MISKLQSFVILNILLTVNGSFKFTNVKCAALDKDFLSIPQCELKIIKRGVVAFNFNMLLYKVPVTNISINLELLKKSSGYRPFLYNVTSDFCQAMRYRQNNKFSFISVVINIITKDSNLNHTCPFDHDIIIRGLVLKDEMFKLLPLPSGDYLVHIRLASNEDWKARITAYFFVKEDWF